MNIKSNCTVRCWGTKALKQTALDGHKRKVDETEPEKKKKGPLRQSSRFD